MTGYRDAVIASALGLCNFTLSDPVSIFVLAAFPVLLLSQALAPLYSGLAFA